MEALMYFLLALICAAYAFGSNDEKPKKGKKAKNNDDITSAVAAFGMMDYMSDGKLDGNFTSED